MAESLDLTNVNSEVLNTIAEETSGYIRFDDLEKDKPYKVMGFNLFEGKTYGNRVCVMIDGGYLILPDRFNKLLEKEKFSQINYEKLYIKYHGREKGNRLNLSFVDLQDEDIK